MFFIVFLASTTLSLEVNPIIQDIKVYTPNSENLFFNVTNNENESIYFVEFKSSNSDISFLDNKFNMTTGETKRIKAIIDTSVSYQTITPITIFFYKKREVVLEPTSISIDITATQFLPQTVEIIKGGTITWTNKDTLKHTVTSTLFDKDIEPQQTFSQTFNNLESISYFDKFTSYTGKIIIKDTIGTDYVHSPLKDNVVDINIHSVLVETQLNISFFDDINFTVEYNKEKEGVLTVHNVGNKIASLINLKSSPDWISFGKKDFYLESGQVSYIPFTIKPLFLKSEDTGKSQIVNIIVTSNNTLPFNVSISVFVPFKANLTVEDSIAQFFNKTLSDDFLIVFFNLICDKFPEHPKCKPQIIEKIVYQSPPVPYTYTQEDIAKNERKTLEIYNSIERYNKDIHEQMDSVIENSKTTKDSTTDMQVIMSKLDDRQTETEKTIDNLITLLIVLGVITALSVSGYLIFKSASKKIDMENEFGT